MRIRVSKWGHSLAVRIPSAFAKQLGVVEGSAVEISASEDAIVLSRPGYTLEGLLEQVTQDNLHGEIDTGPPAGREEW